MPLLLRHCIPEETLSQGKTASAEGRQVGNGHTLRRGYTQGQLRSVNHVKEEHQPRAVLCG